MNALVQWFDGKKTYLLAIALLIFSNLQTDPNFAALLGHYSGMVNEILALLIMWARSMTNTVPATTVVIPPVTPAV